MMYSKVTYDTALERAWIVSFASSVRLLLIVYIIGLLLSSLQLLAVSRKRPSREAVDSRTAIFGRSTNLP